MAADDAPGAVVMLTIIRKKTYHKLTVVVTDEDEDGSISLSALQPQVGVGLTATLTGRRRGVVIAMRMHWQADRSRRGSGSRLRP